ncbi:high affinity cAMP-specific and IBMX-insensitive 3',5'-cyclic phosphodiesterase 8-like [Arctopsyche grandis]|uniref:high affinity cAMP-specific and IBMX-insensitive 3',5'-cyclic phosphodiesterase 8-like n=1 Tax=Arctopsyche grandis TaxID=121162 RepID=UPI00406D73C4
MGCTPSMLFDHKKGHRDSTGSQDQVGVCEAGSPLGAVRVDAPRTAPRASMDSDGFSVQLSAKKDSFVSQMGNNFSTTLHIKRISGGSGGSPGARIGHRKSSLALTPEDEPLDVTMDRPNVVRFDEHSSTQRIHHDDDGFTATTTKSQGCWDRFTSIFKDPRYSFGVRRLSSSDDSNNSNSRVVQSRNHHADEAFRKRTSEISVVSYEPNWSIASDDLKQMSMDYLDNMGYFVSEESVEQPETSIQNTYKGTMPDNRRVSLKPSIFLSKIQEEDNSSVSTISEQYYHTNLKVPPTPRTPSPSPSQNRNSAGGITGGIIIPQQDPVKVLAVMFPERDRVMTAIFDGSARIGMEASTARPEDALDACQSRCPALLLVDSRTARIDAENLCRAMRNLKCTAFSVIIAVVKKSHYVKEDFSIVPFLDAGFNRVVVESTSANLWGRELTQLWRGLGRPLAQSGVTKVILAAVQKCKDVVHITDDNFRIQYVNRAGERLLGLRCEEASGKTLGEPGAELVSQLARGRDWEGAMPLRRRAPSDLITLSCKATPVSCDNRNTTHYVFISESNPAIGNPGAAWDVARGSLHSVRRGSLDVRSVGSDGLRRASLAKLQGLPLEAPITKVISLLMSAQEGGTPQTVALIDRAVDVLRTTELYSPHMREDYRLRSDDPVANDLIGALLSQGPTTVLSSRRSSNDSTVIRAQTSRQNVKHKAPVQIRELLETSLQWDFDIFKLEDLTKRRPLVHLGFNLMCHFNGCSVLECEERTMLNWLTVIEMNYRTSNTYHNSTHAADVMQAVACYMRKDQLREHLEPLDEIAALIAAAAHDLDHPGTSSAFLCNSRHPLAILYNDLAVLESHHAALTFKLTLNDDRVNIFKNLDREMYKIARQTVIDMILATEMTRHFEHLAKFVNVFCPKANMGSKEDIIGIEPEMPSADMNLQLSENVTLVKRMMIKCADVSNPSRSIKYCVEWARRIAEEYFLQTDEEKARELPVVMPVFDRATCSIPRSQIGFIEFIIIHMVEAWDAFIDMPELLAHTKSNYQYWRDMDEKGVTTLQDIKNMQATLVAPSLSIPKSSPE